MTISEITELMNSLGAAWDNFKKQNAERLEAIQSREVKPTAWVPFTNEESKLAVDAFNKALPGVYGIAEAIDEMLENLVKAGIVSRGRP